MKTLVEHLREWRVPFQDHMGFEVEDAGKGWVAFSLELRPEHLNTAGVAHGGVLMALLDTALTGAARTSDAHFNRVATLDLSTSFVRAARGRVTARSRVIRGGRSIVFCEGEIVDSEGEVVAKAIGTFKYSPLKDDPS